ncbi:type II toxin-antitoxin system VapC family toxin [bacterium]|nr:type II toxin-antitoxin system VapC family toxin [bacterium]
MLTGETRGCLRVHRQPKRLSAVARKLINDSRNELLFSVASLWEIVVTRSLGRDDFRVEPRLLRRGRLDNGYAELAIGGEHALAVDSLPPIHTDPFDRLLVAQAQIESVTLLTADPLLGRYPGPIRRV